ncbi:MAG: hypothetical protein JSS30_06370 [Verrucomicrobia bacterium]|nr:hypothetical protein [Verrucomicrobiota bacterium]
MSSSSNNFLPTLNPQIAKDLAAYEAAQEAYQFDCQEIQRLAAALSHMKNPMFGVQEVMSAVMNMSGDQISTLSAMDNIDTDMRNMLQDAQNGCNTLQTAPGNPDVPSKQQIADAQQIINNIDGLEAFLKWQQSLGKDSIFDQGTISNMLSAIKNIKGDFTESDGSGQTINVWGNASGMAAWLMLANQNAGNGYDSALKTLQDGFQTLNQSTSALSTTTNTQLQFQTEQYKQYLGIDQSSIQAYLKLTSAMIQNEKTS